MDVVVLVTIWTFLLREGMPLFTELLISQEKMNWTSTEEYCEEWNGRLIVLDSQEKWNYFTSHDQYKGKLLEDNIYWIGMRFNDSIKCDQTKAYTPWMYTGWGRWANTKNEPNWCPRQQCVRIELNLMRTTACTKTHQVLCEREMVNPTIKHDQMTNSSTELAEVKPVTSSITFSKPEQHAPSPSLLTMTSTPEANDTRSTDSSTHSRISEPETALTISIATSRTEADMTSYDPIASAMSAISTTAALVTSEVENHTCLKCCSSRELDSRKLDKYELDESLLILRAQLAVNKTGLSAYRRKLISVYDSRPSSVALGGVAGAILVMIIGMIVVPDGLALGKFMRKRYSTQHKTLVV